MLRMIADTTANNFSFGTIILGLGGFTAWLIRESFKRSDKREDDANAALAAAHAQASEALSLAHRDAREERDAMRKEVVDTLRDLASAQEAQYVVTDGLISYFREQQGMTPPATPGPKVTRPARRQREAPNVRD